MSRSYRVSVRESLNRVIKAEDHVSTQLEILEVLPCEEMSELLAGELEQRGFERDGDTMVRKQNGVTITVDPATGTVDVHAEDSEQTKVEGEKHGRAWDDMGPSGKSIREGLRKDLQRDLEKQVDKKQSDLQGQVTDRLEGELQDIRQELDQAVNRVTSEALKIKASRMGQIKEMTEDPEQGSLTIVVEV